MHTSELLTVHCAWKNYPRSLAFQFESDLLLGSATHSRGGEKERHIFPSTQAHAI